MLEKSSLEKHQPSLDLTTVTARGGTYAVASRLETIYGTKNPASGRTSALLSL
jgi:hypothetical protein